MNPQLTINEHPAPGYSARTQFNVRSAHLTVAIAVRFDTAGESLTRRLARDRYLAISLADPAAFAAPTLAASMREHKASVLNVAGNGIYTLSQHGWTQNDINERVLSILRPVRDQLERIVTGGQTGVDLAGAVAGVVLGIPVVMTLPKGFKQRDARGVDQEHTHEEMVAMVMGYAHDLSAPDAESQSGKPPHPS
jgi:hypothetical protein